MTILRLSCLRLTCYPVPAYENKFCYRSTASVLNGAVLMATVNVNRNFASVQELVDQVNADTYANTYRLDIGTNVQGPANLFAWNATTRKTTSFDTGTAGNVQIIGYLDDGKNGMCYHNLAFRLGFANEYRSRGVFH